MKKLFVSSVILLSAFLSFGQQIHLTSDVKNAVIAALNKDVDLTNQNIEKQKLELQRKSIWNKYLPKIEANALYGYLNSKGNLDLPTVYLPITGYPLFGSSTDFSTKGQVFHGGVLAKTVLFSGGQIYNGAKATGYKNEGTSYIMDLRADEVVKDIILSFDQLEMLRSAKKLIDESEKRLSKETERVEKAISLGLAIPYDRDKIKLATLELQSKKTDVLHKQELLILKINQATGIPKEDISQFTHEVTPIIILDELGTNNRNEIKALESFKTASEYAVKKEKGSLLPTLGAFGSYSYTSLFNAELSAPLSVLNTTAHLKTKELTMNPTWMMGVAMKWELFSGFERKHKIEEAKLNSEQLENKLTDTKEKLNLQLQKNKMEYENALLQIAIARQKESIAENNNILAEKQYKSGLINVNERLSAENDIYKESLNMIETIIKQRQIALETYQSSGSLSSFILIK